MKKLLTLLSMLTLVITAAVCFNASAAEERVVIDNIVYELTSQKYGRYDYGEHYAVTDFFYDKSLADTTTKINIVDEIDGIEVLGIKTNYDDSPDLPSPAYTNKYPTIKEVIIPDTVKYIGFYAFNCFPSIEKLYLPEELIGFEEGAFYGMEALRSITIPSGIRTISTKAFKNCKSLTKVVLNENVTHISEQAFSGCESLTTINFSASLTLIDEDSFDNTAFKKIVIPENVKVFESPFSECMYLEKIVFENTSSSKEDYLDFGFLDCTPAVKELYIKTIPTKGIMLSEYTLEDLPNLEKIYFAGSEEKWNELTYENLGEELEHRGIEVEFYYKHSHSFKQSGKATCKSGGTYTYTCECGDSYKQSVSKNEVKHKYGVWKTTKKATYIATGTKQRTCSVCGKIEKKTLYKLRLDDVEKVSYESTLDKITLSWDAVKGATGYRVYLYNRDTGKYSKIASIKGKTSYTVKNLEKGAYYRFRVQPYNKDSKGNVAFGPEGQEYHTYTRATSPANLKAVSAKEGVVTLTWETSGSTVGYSVSYGMSKEDVIAGKFIDSYYNGSEETETIKNLKSGQTYYFIISTSDNIVDGAKTTNIAEVTVK